MSDENPPREPGLPPPERFAETEAARICSLIVFAIVMLVSAQILYMIQTGVPALIDVFEDFGPSIALPVTTRIVVSPMFRATIALLALGSVVKELAIKNRRTTLIVNGVHLFVLFALQELIRAGLFQPLFSLMNALGE